MDKAIEMVKKHGAAFAAGFVAGSVQEHLFGGVAKLRRFLLGK